MKAEILRMIRSSEKPVPGRMICEELHISRHELERAVAQFEFLGYDIEEEPEGFVMYSYPDSISNIELTSRMTSTWAGKRIHYTRETGSTNDDAIKLADAGREHGLLVVTENQVNGKGRRGRSWETEDKAAIFMSLLLRPELKPDQAPMLTLVMALSVADVLSKLTDLDVKIKWPNDILVNKKKVCGILTEMSTKPDGINHVVIGVGINVNNSMFPMELMDKATSLMMETGNRWSRADIIISVMDHFEYYYDLFISCGDLSALVTLYDGYLVNKDKKVRVLDPQGEFEGTAEGINDYGELIVQKDEGGYTRVSSGEVSVRGIYGYV